MYLDNTLKKLSRPAQRLYMYLSVLAVCWFCKQSALPFSFCFRAFTPLKFCGGFELLTMKEKSRTELSIVSYGSCSTEEMRCFGTGRIYIRPVQIDITLDDSNLDWGDQYEDCMICKMPVAMSTMRRHMETCGNEVMWWHIFNTESVINPPLNATYALLPLRKYIFSLSRMIMMISRQCWIPKIREGLTPGETKTDGVIEDNLITVSLNWYPVLHIFLSSYLF